MSERIVLSWLNYNFEHQRNIIWNPEDADGSTNKTNSYYGANRAPPSRWVVNYDLDLLDGLVFAASLAAYCPWLVRSTIFTLVLSFASPFVCILTHFIAKRRFTTLFVHL